MKGKILFCLWLLQMQGEEGTVCQSSNTEQAVQMFLLDKSCRFSLLPEISRGKMSPFSFVSQKTLIFYVHLEMFLSVHFLFPLCIFFKFLDKSYIENVFHAL